MTELLRRLSHVDAEKNPQIFGVKSFSFREVVKANTDTACNIDEELIHHAKVGKKISYLRGLICYSCSYSEGEMPL